MPDRTLAYFDDLVRRASDAQSATQQPAPDMRANACHDNCEAFAAANIGFEVVRGWLAFGGHFFIPHSVVREHASGNLIDITPVNGDPGLIPFVEHRGSEADFRILRQGRDGGWMHPQPEFPPSGSFTLENRLI
jgi:hypothetical protein